LMKRRLSCEHRFPEKREDHIKNCTTKATHIDSIRASQSKHAKVDHLNRIACHLLR